MHTPLGLPPEDLDLVTEAVGPLWAGLRGRRLLLTGATGFIGRWLLGTLLHANQVHVLGASVLAVSRDPDRFLAAHPALRDRRELAWLATDVRALQAADGPRCDLAVHAATDVVARRPPAEVFEVCVQGTRQVLQAAQAWGVQRLLLLSSGAVYGPQPAGLARLPEGFAGGPDPLAPASAYAEGKRASELLCALAAAETGLVVPVARCFAFVGPHLPLDAQFAIGNFIGAAVRGQPVVVQGDGTPMRSYLYAADLAIWLWHLLLRGQGGRAYNVGGDEAVSIGALAQRVVTVLGGTQPVQVAARPVPGVPPSAYLPDIGRARDELGLLPRVDLDQAITRTARWARAQEAA